MNRTVIRYRAKLENRTPAGAAGAQPGGTAPSMAPLPLAAASTRALLPRQKRVLAMASAVILVLYGVLFTALLVELNKAAQGAGAPPPGPAPPK